MYIFDALMTRILVSEIAVEKEIERLKYRVGLRGEYTANEVWDYLDTIDAKAAALLGHISIFAAVSGILLASGGQETFTQMALLCEFIALLFLTFLSLRCLRMFVTADSDKVQEVILRSAVREMLYRRKIYIFTHSATGVVTIALIITAAAQFDLITHIRSHIFS